MGNHNSSPNVLFCVCIFAWKEVAIAMSRCFPTFSPHTFPPFRPPTLPFFSSSTFTPHFNLAYHFSVKLTSQVQSLQWVYRVQETLVPTTPRVGRKSLGSEKDNLVVVPCRADPEYAVMLYMAGDDLLCVEFFITDVDVDVGMERRRCKR